MAVTTQGVPSISATQATTIAGAAMNGHGPSKRYVDATCAAAARGNPTARANAHLLERGTRLQHQAAYVGRHFGGGHAKSILVGAHLA